MVRLFPVLLLLVSCLRSETSAGTAAGLPNLLVILTDDQGLADYGGFGTKDLRTPHIDRLFREGMTFDNFHANSPVCSPTRAALLSGCFPDRVGVPGVIRHVPEDSWGNLADSAVLLPRRLKDAGYHTAIVGKWHLGLEAPDTPLDRGFDHFHGFLGDMMDDYWNHRRGGKNFMRRDREVIDPEGHATDLFSTWASAYAEERARSGRPFFLYLAYNAPHTPIQPPHEWLERVQKREPGLDAKRAKLVALIEHLDAGIGRVLDALDRSGAAPDTLVIFTSDNGGQLDAGARNGPWRSGKQHMYEGGLRVPFAARWPGRIKPGSRCGRMALTMDLFPTLLEAAGAAPEKGIDGASFLPSLKGEAPPDPSRELYFIRREGGPYKGRTIEALRLGDWKLVHDMPDKPLELFNLAADPKEERDLSGEEKKVFEELSTVLKKHLERGTAVPWQPPGR
jgi:arylsulfatase A-like enzyme